MEEKCIYVIKASRINKVLLDEILYIERDGRKLKIVTRNESFEYYEKLANVLTSLDERFYPCLEGCYINLEKVVSLFDGEIAFGDGISVWIGRQNFQRTLKDFAAYARNKGEREKVD